MPTALKPYFQKELTEAENTFTKRHFQQSWRHLERAHILGQPYPIAHSFVHWKMLEFGIKTKNTKEIIGQIPRLLVGGVAKIHCVVLKYKPIPVELPSKSSI